MSRCLSMRASLMTREEVIEGYGRARFEALIGRAVVVLKEDRRLVGLDRLRVSLAREACEVAIGCPRRTYEPSRRLLRSGSVPAFCDELVAACALRLKVDGHV